MSHSSHDSIDLTAQKRKLQRILLLPWGLDLSSYQSAGLEPNGQDGPGTFNHERLSRRVWPTADLCAVRPIHGCARSYARALDPKRWRG